MDVLFQLSVEYILDLLMQIMVGISFQTAGYILVWMAWMVHQDKKRHSS